MWLIIPAPATPVASTSKTPADATLAARPPAIEYLATLSKHDGIVNVVRWSPDGKLLASAGDGAWTV